MKFDLEISALIMNTSASRLAKVLLPFFDNYSASKGNYRHTIHDDGDHLFIEFNDEWGTEFYFEETGGNWHVMHLSSEAPHSTKLRYAKDLVGEFDKHDIVYRLEISKEMDDGRLYDEEYIYHRNFPRD